MVLDTVNFEELFTLVGCTAMVIVPSRLWNQISQPIGRFFAVSVANASPVYGPDSKAASTATSQDSSAPCAGVASDRVTTSVVTLLCSSRTTATSNVLA